MCVSIAICLYPKIIILRIPIALRMQPTSITTRYAPDDVIRMKKVISKKKNALNRADYIRMAVRNQLALDEKDITGASA